MKVRLDAETIESINFFQNLTGAYVMDMLSEDDTLYFVVGKGQYGYAVGKNGEKIKKAENLFKKKIRILEYFDTVLEFITAAIPEAKNIEVKDGVVKINVPPSERPKVIGKSGSKIRALTKITERLYETKGIKLLTPVRM